MLTRLEAAAAADCVRDYRRGIFGDPAVRIAALRDGGRVTVEGVAQADRDLAAILGRPYGSFVDGDPQGFIEVLERYARSLDRRPTTEGDEHA